MSAVTISATTWDTALADLRARLAAVEAALDDGLDPETHAFTPAEDLPAPSRAEAEAANALLDEVAACAARLAALRDEAGSELAQLAARRDAAGAYVAGG